MWHYNASNKRQEIKRVPFSFTPAGARLAGERNNCSKWQFDQYIAYEWIDAKVGWRTSNIVTSTSPSNAIKRGFGWLWENVGFYSAWKQPRENRRDERKESSVPLSRLERFYSSTKECSLSIQVLEIIKIVFSKQLGWARKYGRIWSKNIFP